MQHDVVSRDEWLQARKELLAKEKEFTQRRDEMTRQIRSLPWEKVEKSHAFQGPTGKESLAELFGDHDQLAVYHFMLGPGWTEGCPSCSLLADHFNGIPIHLANRNVAFVAVSRAPLEEIDAYKRRMGWDFKWVSSQSSDFNFDFGVSFEKEDVDAGNASYNYAPATGIGEEMPGASFFYKDGGGIYHTYSTYGRGLDLLIGTYNWLDLAPKGRDEDGLDYTMAWVRRHDQYESE
jgi:predicted dithiol-disulfide oxidoreductase (DUF899 family)